VMNFRREHRGILRKILTRVFSQAVAKRLDPCAVRSMPELEVELRMHALGRLDRARHMDVLDE
jgi:hypothetical protein